MKTKLLYYLLHPVALSLFFGSLIIYLLPLRFEPYVIEKVDKTHVNQGIDTYYVDLDGDGHSERIDLNHNYKNTLAVLVYKGKTIVNQWNFRGKAIGVGATFWGDVDSDGSLELVMATWRDDSIYIHCFNPLSGSIFLSDRAIALYKPASGEVDCSIHMIGFYNSDGRERKKLYFSTVAGLVLRPRKMFAYNFGNDSLYISPKACINWLYPFAAEMEANGRYLFTGNTQAVGNCDSLEQYTDYFSWFTVLDNEMHFKFLPIKIGYYPSTLDVAILSVGNKRYFILLNRYMGTGKHNSSIILFSADGQKLLERSLTHDDTWENAGLVRIGRNVYIIKQNGLVEKLDKALNRTQVTRLPALSHTMPYMLDLDRDGRNELVFINANRNRLIITRRDFSDPAMLDIDDNDSFLHVSLILNGPDKAQLMLAGDSYNYMFRYARNLYYSARYLFLIAIFGILYLIFIQLDKQHKNRAEQKYRTEKQIAELQLRSIKGQLDPHFTLNIINTIGSLFYKQDKERADYLFGKYSKLLRTTILGSESICYSIGQEIDYVQDYLELEHYRLGERFSYDINIDDAIDRQYLIPKMLIHTFVENAIKHGLRKLKGQGLLHIAVKKERDVYQIIIRDNGIGRDGAAKYKIESTGRGLDILEQILELYYDSQKVRISFRMRDLKDADGQAAGTEVIITVPYYGNAVIG